jgi:predicted chitinase
MAKQKKAPIKSAKPKADNSFRDEVSLTCACSRDITLAELGKVYFAQRKDRLEKFLPHLNATFAKYKIDSCLKKAHFLAQVGHETGQLTFLAEQLGKGVKEKDVYDGYKGRGLIQITYKDGYKAYGEYIGQDFLGDKKANLEEIASATDSAGWYWDVKTSPTLNGYAASNDLIYITQSINGAFNGYDDRVAQLKRAAEALLVENCPIRLDCPNTSTFHLNQSAANDIPAAAFAWGLWHDKKSGKHGMPKDDAEARLGYTRFLELKKAQSRGRFGFKKPEDMIEHAEVRLKELEGAK